jgi:hypothetical protein
LEVDVAAASMEIQQGFASTSEVGVDEKIRILLEDICDTLFWINCFAKGFPDAQEGCNVFGSAAVLFPYRKIATLVVGKVNDVSLIEHAAVSQAHDGAIRFMHAFCSYELLWRQKVDRAIRDVKSIDKDVYGVAIDVCHSPSDTAMTFDG